MLKHWLRLAPVVVPILVACGESGTGTGTGIDPMAVARVTIEAPRNDLSVGSTLQLAASPANAAGTILTDKHVDWVSSRPDVATITTRGLVTGLASGTTVITATSGGRTATLSLLVQPPSRIVLTSDAGDYIGGGRSYSYTKADAILQLTVSATAVQVSVAGNERWNGNFQVPSGVQLTAGTRYDGTRWPFHGTGAGLSWYGEGRGCNTLTGFFVVDSIRWSGAAGSSPIEAIALRFQQQCEGGTSAMRGSIIWRADEPTVAAGPALPIPSTLWRPASGAVPATGNFVYLQSDAGDFIGQGATSLTASGFPLSSTGRRLTVSAAGYTLEFEAMSSLTQLQAGYYASLIRYPFHNPIRGGLSVHGNGRGCNSLAGWVAVDRVHYASGALAGIEMRFAQHCEGMTAALRGMVRWGQFP